jgi:hypothetical protein
MLQVEIDQNLAKISYLTLFDLQWLKLTFKQQNMYVFGISEQDRATLNVDLHMRVFNLQGLRAPDRPKKKVRRIYFFILLQLFKDQPRSMSTKL